jgi:acetolactate synthase-1/2/3 large subunit
LFDIPGCYDDDTPGIAATSWCKKTGGTKRPALPTFADVVAKTLADAGIEFIYGVPGSFSSLELIEAASKRGIRYVLCNNESSAAVMAGTYGVLTNRPGVVSTGLGPGAVAAVHGVANCMLERAPCLVLTDRYSDAEFRQVQRQRIDHDVLFRSITKGSFKLATDTAALTMRGAIALAMEGRQGPVHVDLPYDVMVSDALLESTAPSDSDHVDMVRTNMDHAALASAAQAILASKAPAIIVGLQVNRSGLKAESAFLAFAEHLRAPVFASLAAKGTLPEHHPLAAGTFRGVAAEHQLLDRADLLVVVGFDPVELFAPGRWNHRQPVVFIDEVPHDSKIIDPQVEVVGDLAESLRFLADNLPATVGWETSDLDSYRSARLRLLYPEGDGLMPGAVIRIAREHLADEGIMTVDAGSHKILAGDTWAARRPRGFLTSSGLGSMAVALPAAMTAKMVEPETAVLCLTGDGGFLMRLGDLEVAAREGLAIVVIIFNDGYLNLIKMQQDARSLERRGTKYRDSDYAAVARGLGFQAVQVNTEDQLSEALSSAFNSGQPWLIDAVVNPDGYA